MIGPEHYEAAEKLLAAVKTSSGLISLGDHRDVLAAAQVHATLALADAATRLVSDHPAVRNAYELGREITRLVDDYSFIRSKAPGTDASGPGASPHHRKEQGHDTH